MDFVFDDDNAEQAALLGASLELSDQIPLDPDLFNPDVVGHTFANISGPDGFVTGDFHEVHLGSDYLPPASDQIYHADEDWEIDGDEGSYGTDDDYVNDEEASEDSDNASELQSRTKSRRSRARARAASHTNSESSGSENSSDEDEEEDAGDDEHQGTDLTRLIDAIHTNNFNKEAENRGLLSKEWDRSMDQELSELQEAERTMRPGRRKRHKIRGEPELSTEVSILLGKANICFIEKKYEEAIPLFEEAVRIEPMCKMAWNNLGAIYQDLNDFEKACQFRMIGAHLTAKSEHLWKELGAESRQHGLLSQAIYCFSEAIKAGKDDVEAMWDRSYLLYEVGRPRQALTGYLAILKLNPHNPDVLREIAHLCATTDEKELPVKLFKAALEHYRSVIPTPTNEWLQDGFGIHHVRILIDLLMKSCQSIITAIEAESAPMSVEERQRSHYVTTLNVIKLSNRWIQGRGDLQSAEYLDWDLLDDDREFDVFRKVRDDWELLEDPRYEETPTYPLDNDFRAYLGICRLKIGDDEEAKVHFDMIKELDIVEFSELFVLIGDAYYEFEMWHEALEFYQELADNDSTNNPSVWHKIGQCYRKAGNLEEAAECYEAIVETDYMDLIAKSQLAEIYELAGRRDEAYSLVDDIIEIRRNARAQGVVIEKDPISTNDRGLGANPIRVNNPLAARTTGNKSINERRMEETIRTEKYLSSYKRLEELSTKLNKDGQATCHILMNEFVRIANPMVEGFRQTTALFPCALTKKFAGVHAPPKRAKKDAEKATDVSEDAPTQTAIQEFRGIYFPDWVRIFVHYAFCCVKIQRTDEASEVLGHVMIAPIFRQSAAMSQVLRLAYAAVCYAKGDFVAVTDTIRWLSLRLTYHNDPVRLISALLSQGFQQSMAFANANLQKWFLRQIKLIDEHVAEAKTAHGDEGNDHPNTLILRSGAPSAAPRSRSRGRTIQFRPTEDDDEGHLQLEDEEDEDESYWKASKFRPQKSNPVFVLSFAQILAATRSFQSSIVHYLRVYETYPNEPLLNLLLGVSYSQRSMQRQTDNRHHQIIQAAAFFDQYKKLRSSKYAKEVEYNFGRFYHGLGLSTLAIAHYERVISLSSNSTEARDQEMVNFSSLAAYNLALIYMTTGSADLAHRLICEHLSV